MSELDSQYVKHGFWIDHSKGEVMGATLTTSTNTGAIVIALLAVLSSVAASHLWNLIVFAYHQLRVSDRPQDGLFHQQQAVLRTTAGPFSMFTDSVRLWWAWRNKVDHASLRSAAQSTLAILFAAATVAVSIASNYVVDSTNVQVLVSSPFCKVLDISPDGVTHAMGNYIGMVEEAAVPYSRNCYGKNESLPASCRVFAVPNVHLTSEHVACPFESRMCTVGQTFTQQEPAVQVDSGLVDVSEAFGLNLHAKDRVKYRKTTTCSVLPLDGYTQIIPATDFPSLYRSPLPNEELMLWFYGSDPWSEDVLWGNASFEASLVRSNVTQAYAVLAGTIYPGWAISSFDELPELKRNDANVALIWIGFSRVPYTSPVDDLLYAAHSNFSYTVEHDPEYTSDFPGKVVGCAEQYQFCVTTPSGKDQCTSLGHLLSPSSIHSTLPSANAIQTAVINLLIRSSILWDLAELSATVLDATYVHDHIPGTGTLPNNQWEIEISAWESFVWAGLQTVVSDYAVGPELRDPMGNISAYARMPNTTAEKQLCGMQKMTKAGDVVNINVFGLALVTACALFFLILDLTLLKCLVFFSRFRRALAPRVESWIQDGVLQLQRKAFEASNMNAETKWMRLGTDIPVTEGNAVLYGLPRESGFVPSFREGGVRKDLGEKGVSMSMAETDGSDTSMKNIESKDGGPKKVAQGGEVV